MASAFAQEIPECLDGGRSISVDNQQVLNWKRTTPNEFKERAYISGVLVAVYPDRNGHDHFQIQIGERPDETIEVVYNYQFGFLPNQLLPGMEVQACGDYITTTAQSTPTASAPNGYPPSPDGAIIHWLHKNPRGRGHESGFLVIDGALYGHGYAESPGRGRDGGGGRSRRTNLVTGYDLAQDTLNDS
ncbi:MAG: DUF3465 domain-containing protein [Oligoflexia bacterium]|nr:DUF3465 domain-containing protein [Oligoflexia bacterium]